MFYTMATQWLAIRIKMVSYTVEIQLLEQAWNQKSMFETGVVRANEC